MGFAGRGAAPAARYGTVGQTRPFIAGEVAEAYAYAETEDDPVFGPGPDASNRKHRILAGIVAFFATRR